MLNVQFTGQALNLDLSDFVAELYACLSSLSTSYTLEVAPKEAEQLQDSSSQPMSKRIRVSLATEADLLFRALEQLFIASRIPNPPMRCMAFSKRLLICALNWPRKSAMRAIELVGKMLAKDSTLEGMLTTEDLQTNGVYQGEVDNPNLANANCTVWWELVQLSSVHYDESVRTLATSLSNWVQDK